MRNEKWSSFYGGPWMWPGMAFARGSRFFESGELRLALLSLLGDGPKHGYQLMKELEERSGGLYKASAGGIYPTLQQLEDEDLIRSDQQNGKRVYNLTEAGRSELEKNADAVRRIWERAEKWEEWSQYMTPDILTLLKPLAGVGQAAWRAAGRASGNTEKEDRIRDVLDRARRELEEL